jgi:hypothetical protein
MTVFWDVVPCSLVEVYQCFRGVYCIHYQGDDSSQCTGLHRLGLVAQIMFRFGPGSNNTNQVLYRTFEAFSGYSLSAEKKLFVDALVLITDEIWKQIPPI